MQEAHQYDAGNRAAAMALHQQSLPAMTFTMQSIDHLTCYGKRIFTARAGLPRFGRYQFRPFYKPALRPPIRRLHFTQTAGGAGEFERPFAFDIQPFRRIGGRADQPHLRLVQRVNQGHETLGLIVVR